MKRFRLRGRLGVALVMVILVLVILTVMATGFAAFTASDMRASDATIDGTTAYFLAQAGIDYALYLVKHNMAVYPSASGYDVGYRTGGSEASNPYYSSATYKAGEISDLFQGRDATDPTIPDATNGQEHVVVSELSFSASLDWMYQTRYCGTFRVSMGSPKASGTNYSYKIMSIGYIKRYPASLNGKTDDQMTVSDFSNVGTWSIKAQRTVYSDISVSSDGNLYTNSGGDTPYMGPNTPVYGVQPNTYYEKWR